MLVQRVTAAVMPAEGPGAAAFNLLTPEDPDRLEVTIQNPGPVAILVLIGTADQQPIPQLAYTLAANSERTWRTTGAVWVNSSAEAVDEVIACCMRRRASITLAA
jgi:hypothetical protein